MSDDDEVKTYTVYCVIKKVPDENYDMYVGLTDNILIEHDLRICKCQSKHLPTNFYKRMQKVGVRNWEITPLFRKECSYKEIIQHKEKYRKMLQLTIGRTKKKSKKTEKNLKSTNKNTTKKIEKKLKRTTKITVGKIEKKLKSINKNITKNTTKINREKILKSRRNLFAFFFDFRKNRKMADDEVKKRTVYVLSKKIPDENNDTYVGSTSKPMNERLSTHKHCSLRACNEKNKLYVRISQVGIENWKITPIFEKTCSKDEVLKLEKDWVKVLNANPNSYSPYANVRNTSTLKTQKRNVDKKKYFCNFCEKAFQSPSRLKQHFSSLKHQYAYFNSLD